MHQRIWRAALAGGKLGIYSFVVFIIYRYSQDRKFHFAGTLKQEC
jgi:hypothetical protein